ncbi:MAG TPA: PilZ domain-containing protein [Thermoanaerobaculia bacterium]
MIEERREFQRLNLTKPLDGWFGDFSVLVVEISATGAKLVHDEPIPMGSRGLLRFTWRGRELEILSQVTRSEGARSGVHFLQFSDDLRTLVTESANEVLRAQQANAEGDRKRNVVGDETLTAASAGARALSGFLQYHLTGKGWKCHRALLPDQPDDGFTVSANESQEQIDLLCRTYESGDEEAKRMTRMIAQLSVTR